MLDASPNKRDRSQLLKRENRSWGEEGREGGEAREGKRGREQVGGWGIPCVIIKIHHA
jgi:hypothetical protein